MTWHIHIQGLVQGVGFRPFVFLLAKKYELTGWVNNTTNGVHIEMTANEELAQKFYQKIITDAPVLSRITAHSILKTEQKFFDNFQIIHSENSGRPNLLLTPDFAICEVCKSEVHSISNRRNGYAFTTCTHCGPRFSMIKQLPYDRENTAMKVFQMCPTCKAEYENPQDRRYFSQTNSCPDCRIELTLFDKNKNEVSGHQSEILDKVVSFWQAGKIVAIKGIGGYLLTCDANNPSAISELRKRKHRPKKPFAIMFPSISFLKKTIHLQKNEKEELTNPVAPIVLLNFQKEADSILAKKEIAPHSNQLGVMLPYTPLYDLLLQGFGKPIIATSGNISNSPIIFEDKNALAELAPIADFMLTNNRAIVAPQDDSVVRFSFFKNQKIMLRRSRGIAPTYINPKIEWSNKSILAMGAMMKSTFSFLHDKNTYVSQYLGDLENFDTQENYKYTVKHFLKLFNAAPEIILLDKHSDYHSTQFGQNLAKKINIPAEAIQHHVAHFGAIIGEHNLVHSDEPILGVIWDGTGLGNDGQIWGGEFFKYEKYDFLRTHHFDYFDFILGNKMPKEPRISALSICWGMEEAEPFLKNKFTKIEWQIYSKILNKKSALQTSSTGRIFDAVASLLGIMDIQTYEGEAAMQLEYMALEYFKTNGLAALSSYFMEDADCSRISTKTLMTNIVRDLQKGKQKKIIAAKFHFSLMKIIKTVAKNLKIKKIAFSGGVFQNGLLVDLIQHHLQNDFELFFHQQLSPNDENISFGQLVCYQIQQHRKSVF